MALAARLADYRGRVQECESLIVAAHRRDANGTPLFAGAEQVIVTEAAFLRSFVAWESFLEGAIVDYMLGLPSAVNNIVARWVTPASEAQAREMLIGTQKYVDYANPEIVRKLARIVLHNGRPFDTTLASVQGDLFDLKTVRNAAAHLSSTTTTAFDGLVQRRLARGGTAFSVHAFLLAADPAVPAGTGAATTTIFKSYLQVLDAAAAAIANA